MADDAMGDQGARRRSSRRGSAFDSLTNREQNARLNEILEAARERAEGWSSPSDQLPSRQRSGDMNRPSMDAARPSADENRPDENTALMGTASQRSVRDLKSAVASQQFPPNDSSRDTTRLGGAASQRQRHAADDVSDDSDDEDTKKTWTQRLFGPFQSVELENKGSVARDHLALERTFLAWLRTSLAFASIGIAVTQLFRLNTSLMKDGADDGKVHALRHMGKPLGATFLGISILTLLLGYRRYLQGQNWVIKGKFPASRGTVIILVAMSFAIMVVSLMVVVLIHPSEDEEKDGL